jgi:hypothetical protein
MSCPALELCISPTFRNPTNPTSIRVRADRWSRSIGTRGWHRNRGFFSGMVRGVSNPREGSEVLTFLFRTRLVCSSLLQLIGSWKVNCANFALTEFSEVLVAPVRRA